jgi:hypothetical protein
VRSSGGVYFALQNHRRVVDQFDRLFAALRPVAETTLAHVRTEVGTPVREVDQILTEHSQGRKVRESTAQRDLEEARRLAALVEEYRVATRDRRAEAAAALELLRVQVAALVSVAE